MSTLKMKNSQLTMGLKFDVLKDLKKIAKTCDTPNYHEKSPEVTEFIKNRNKYSIKLNENKFNNKVLDKKRQSTPVPLTTPHELNNNVFKNRSSLNKETGSPSVFDKYNLVICISNS